MSATVLYLDSSAILRALLENGLSPELEAQIAQAHILVTSRLTLVECARALLRLRHDARIPEIRMADLARELDALWARCDLWELTPAVCELAAAVAPAKALRSLDALHLATFLLARRRLGSVELVTADLRLREAASG